MSSSGVSYLEFRGCSREDLSVAGRDRNRTNNSNNRMPRVQILLSTYNGARYLPEQLQSLQGQDHRDIEILVRDDGSWDGTCGYSTVSRVIDECG